MEEKSKSSNFIEQIIDKDIAERIDKKRLRFRFPPEPNGYLHIGHVKAACLNFNLGQRYNAPVNLRFDDTNPQNEEIKYVQAIKKDLKWLGYDWDKECYASDYFEQLFQWALFLIDKDMAYVDSQSSDVIAQQKGTPTKHGILSPNRSRSREDNHRLFIEMSKGVHPEGAHVLRAKIDMSSPNMLMRDPIIYRVLNKPHHRTGTKWKVYPMYDWTHGESDYIEQISHSLCTLEFKPHRELYNWFLEEIPTKDIVPKQTEFARLNLSFTVTSKRKLKKLVDENYVSGWDDPRMPTISGLRRRGYTPESLKQFVKTAGIAKRENVIELSLLEFCLRDHLNKIAPRVNAVLNPIKLTIINYTKKYDLAYVQLHGEEEPSLCKKLVKVVKVIKAFRVSNDYDINLTNSYIECCDYFLFDTKSDKFGGSGKKFDWGIIRKFTSKKFILSGGIDMSSIEDINKIKKENKCLVAVDINSKFEISPGTKDVQKIKIFLNKLNDGKL